MEVVSSLDKYVSKGKICIIGQATAQKIIRWPTSQKKKSNWSFGIKSVYYESGFNIQLLSDALNIHEKVGHTTVWPYNSKRPMVYFSCPSGKQNIS